MKNRQNLIERARVCMPGGVTAAARKNKYTGEPFVISKAAGSKLYDLNGTAYIDMCMSYGASLLGHRHPLVVDALIRSGEFGIACGMEFPEQVELAERIVKAVPSAHMVRFALSGTETTQYAVKLARVYTGKRLVIKIEGHFHGYNDYLQFNYWPKAGQGLPHVYAETEGLPPASIQEVVVVPYNDLEAVKRVFAGSNDIAAIILEPVNFNSGGIRPNPGYLEGLRDLTRAHGALLIFDEILSGFRTGPDCMQGYYKVTPDISTLGKAIGGGTPLSAFVGSREIMSTVAPDGPMMHSGTYNANAVNIFCGLAFMDAIEDLDFYPTLLERSQRMYDGLNRIFTESGFPALAHGLGARFGLLFGPAAAFEPHVFTDVMHQDWDIAHRFFSEMLHQGVYFNHAWHHGISIAHSEEDIDAVLKAAEVAVGKIRKSKEDA